MAPAKTSAPTRKAGPAKKAAATARTGAPAKKAAALSKKGAAPAKEAAPAKRAAPQLTITRKQIAAELAEAHELPRKQTEAVLNDLMALATRHLNNQPP